MGLKVNSLPLSVVSGKVGEGEVDAASDAFIYPGKTLVNCYHVW